ncbi:hypothetical protein ISS30_02960 [bacterium]|nr:hypothetical protein [bacterium]
MPIFEYKCDNCGAVFDILHHGNTSEDTSQTCPQCSGSGRKIISVPSSLIETVNRRHTENRRQNCDHQSPCCGRETRCDKPPCEV